MEPGFIDANWPKCKSREREPRNEISNKKRRIFAPRRGLRGDFLRGLPGDLRSHDCNAVVFSRAHDVGGFGRARAVDCGRKFDFIAPTRDVSSSTRSVRHARLRRGFGGVFIVAQRRGFARRNTIATDAVRHEVSKDFENQIQMR